MKPIFTFPPPRRRLNNLSTQNPKNLSKQTEPPHSFPTELEDYLHKYVDATTYTLTKVNDRYTLVFADTRPQYELLRFISSLNDGSPDELKIEKVDALRAWGCTDDEIARALEMMKAK
jgi:hypothetical protein